MEALNHPGILCPEHQKSKYSKMCSHYILRLKGKHTESLVVSQDDDSIDQATLESAERGGLVTREPSEENGGGGRESSRHSLS